MNPDPSDTISLAKVLAFITALATFTAAACSLCSCTEEPDVPLAAAVQELAIGGYDPVSYFNESGPVIGSEDLAYTWNDTKYHFSCKENLELFKNNPEKYAPQYNGYCAFAMSRGDYAPSSPDAYTIINDKLYLTYNLDIKNAWLQDKVNYISMADRNWQESKFNSHK